MRIYGSAGSRPTTSAPTIRSNTRPGTRGNADGTGTRMTITPATTSTRPQVHRHLEKMWTILTTGGTYSQPFSPISITESKPSGTSSDLTRGQTDSQHQSTAIIVSKREQLIAFEVSTEQPSDAAKHPTGTFTPTRFHSSVVTHPPIQFNTSWRLS